MEAVPCKLNWNIFCLSIDHVARLVKQCFNPLAPISKDLQIDMKIPFVGTRLTKLISCLVVIIKSRAWKNSISAALKYAGVSDKTRLRLEDPALHLSTSCLHSAIEDLLSVIFDRCCSGIQVLRVILVLSIYLPVLRTPGLYFHGTVISGIEKPQSHI